MADEDEDEDGEGFSENAAATVGPGPIGVVHEVAPGSGKEVTHVQLTRRCQRGGAIAAVIVSTCTDIAELSNMEDTDRAAADITIPSMVVTPQQWTLIKNHMAELQSDITEAPEKAEKPDEDGAEDEGEE